MTITAENLDRELNKVPLLPATINNALSVLQNDDVNITLVEQHLSRDPALAARVLRIANSPFYGLSGKIDNLRDACTVLGIHTARTIVLAAGVTKHLSYGKFNHLDLIALWQHATSNHRPVPPLRSHPVFPDRAGQRSTSQYDLVIWWTAWPRLQLATPVSWSAPAASDQSTYPSAGLLGRLGRGVKTRISKAAQCPPP